MPDSKRIATLTLNPAIDVSSDAGTVRHTHKVRTSNERMEPGGGGINVARVLKRLSADVEALFLAGGVTGRVLDDLVARAGIERRWIPIAGNTRLSLTIVETSTGNEYRFVPEGPEVTTDEASDALEAASKTRCDYLVASGSLPRGVEPDFYARLADRVSGSGVRLVVDSSGPAMRAAIDAGGIFLAKPSRGEFEALVGRKLTNDELADEAMRIVEDGKVEVLAVTLGGDGAVLATRVGVQTSAALPVKACSAVGAGDSFLAGMVHGFAMGSDAAKAFRIGLATGAAAVLSCGSDLAKPEDLDRLVAWAVSGEQVDDLGFGGESAQQ